MPYGRHPAHASYNSAHMNTLLGGLSPSAFLKHHWQRQPLLVRAAIPDFRNLLTLQQLIVLARSDACDARLVVSGNDRHEVLYGPLSKGVFRDLPENNWTLLVQGINHVHPGARALLRRFSFLPHARLDDVMVSYAAPGGGVGPHFDSYDVFLLQGLGQRSWQVGAQTDLELVPDSELKILKRFRPSGSCILGIGDMLYLPPRFAHNGVALDACLTYSIGFRAPGYEELKTQFLAYLDDCIHIDGQYHDPGLTPPLHPAELGNNMINQITDALSRISWNRTDVIGFLGCYLSEPKAHVVLEQPPPLDYREFSRRAQADGVEIHPALPLLFRGRHAFINGEAIDMKSGARKAIIALADQRHLTAGQLRNARRALRTLHNWYRNGYISTGEWSQT